MNPTWADIAGAQLGVARAGLKASGGDDVVVLHAPGIAAAVTTQSTAAAAPCRWTRARAPGPVQAVVINAGNANAATGPEGDVHTRAMAQACAHRLGCDIDQILVCSTGVIGVPLPIAPVERAIIDAAGDLGGDLGRAAAAILTTDTQRKVAGRTIGDVSVGGFAKGSGMIHPNMATMLAFLVTDAEVSEDALQALLKATVDTTFNAVTVDGDTSTNDTVILQATGQGAPAPMGSPAWHALAEALEATCTQLAKAIARDGEGATQLLEVQVHGLADNATARAAAKAVARSPLVKTAAHGRDPNWGRIIGALGAHGVPHLEEVSVEVAGCSVLHQGRPVLVDEAHVSHAMDTDTLLVRVEVPGPGYGVAYGCDLSAGYVSINAEYRT
ncbi:MAG: bifunctional glutamate N-acetyltransferase/amino-acid acetyltransferase ArgJ [Myxococcota bacterium]